MVIPRATIFKELVDKVGDVQWKDIWTEAKKYGEEQKRWGIDEQDGNDVGGLGAVDDVADPAYD